MVHDKPYMFLKQNNAFDSYQFGLRNNHSTNHALIKITEQIRNACDKNLFTCGVYLDLRKAFDTVSHEIFLSKLEHYGIKGTSYNCFKSFLYERMQYTLIKESMFVSHGVPPGSVLGTLLSYLSSSSMSCAIQLNIVKYITMRMTQICMKK